MTGANSGPRSPKRPAPNDTGLHGRVVEDIRSLVENGLLPPGYVLTYEQLAAHYRDIPPDVLHRAVSTAVSDHVLERYGNALWAPDPRWSATPIASVLTLTTVIQDVVRRRIALDLYGPGGRLPVEVLAAEFQIRASSLTETLIPVQEQGLLVAGADSELFVVNPADPAPEKPRDAEVVESIIRERLSDGTYATGTWLPSTSDLASDLGFPRSTVRAALTPLKQEQLVVTVQPFGTYVADPDDPMAVPRRTKRSATTTISRPARGVDE
jgi:DNA-binding GntR family transcriptional regulator